MKKSVIAIMAAVLLTAGVVAQNERPQRGIDRPQFNREEVSKARELLTTDDELKKIEKKYKADVLKRLKELGVSESTAKMITQSRSRDRGNWNRQNGRPQGPRSDSFRPQRRREDSK